MADYLIHTDPPLAGPSEILTRTMPDACRRAKQLSSEHPGLTFEVREIPRREIIGYERDGSYMRGAARADVLHARYRDGAAV
jgi:hypothetical protein